MLNEYWDKPEYTSTTLDRLHSERSVIKLNLSLNKSNQDANWKLEQELRAQLRELSAKQLSLRAIETDLTKDYDRLQTIKIDFAEQMRKANALAELQEKINELESRLKELSENRPFWDAMMPFQKEDLLYAINCWDMGFTGVLNANDTGLGKTFEAITFNFLASKLFIAKYSTNPSSIWITKKSLVKSTCREIRKWFPDARIMPLVGTTATQREILVQAAIASGSMLVCNYDSLDTTPSIIQHHWNFIYADEVHRLKGGANHKPTRLWEAARDLIFESRDKGNSFFLPLSGSPVQNHPKEIWAYLHIFDPIRFPKVKTFERDYCSWYNQGIRIDNDLLIRAMKSQIIRRRKSEVNDQLKLALTEPIIDERWVEMGALQKAAYEQMRKEFFTYLDDEKEDVLIASVIIARLNRLRQLALDPDALLNRSVGSAKIDEAMDIIEELVNEGEQVVVFSSQFNDPLKEIERRCKEFYDFRTEIIVGATKDVDDACERFRQGASKVMLVNVATGGEGLNLQKSVDWPGGASHAVFLDLWWNPEKNKQALDRIYRTGQTDTVTAHYIKAEESIDIYIDSILTSKTEMIGSIMENPGLRKRRSDWKEALEGKI